MRCTIYLGPKHVGTEPEPFVKEFGISTLFLVYFVALLLNPDPNPGEPTKCGSVTNISKQTIMNQQKNYLKI
jgi:hypothetical protein